MTPAQAWNSLVEGNKRYADDIAVNSNRNDDRRHEVSEDPRPFAMILGCADSRVPPEVIFDQGLGDLFTVRLAGNVADANAIGSLEFAVLNFGPTLIVVLGHEQCGAVMATVDAVEKNTSAPGYIGSIVDSIKPAVAPLVGKAGFTLDAAIRANISAVARSLSSNLVGQAADQGRMLQPQGRSSDAGRHLVSVC
jgi:carbonic anhydrase